MVRAEFSGKVIGITGSAGKTTDKSFLAAICSGAGPTIATEGNQNNELGVPLTLAKLNSAAAFAVVEMGAAQMGDIAYLKSMASPQVVILLNAREAHVERFGSLEAIVAAKGEILDNLSEHDTAILNADEPELAAWRARAQPAQVLTFGRSSAADIRLVSSQDRGFDGSVMNVEMYGTPASWRISIPGEPGMVNALAAAAAAQALGIEDKTISDGLASVTPVRGRGDIRQLQNGIRLIDDSYNASPGVIESVDDLINMPISARDGTSITFGDVAVVRRAFRQAEGWSRVNGEPAVVLDVRKRVGANIIKVVELARAVIDEDAPKIGEGVKVSYLFDDSKDVRNLLSDLGNNVAAAVIIVMVVVLAALGLRNATLVGLAIPGSFFIGISILNLMGLFLWQLLSTALGKSPLSVLRHTLKYRCRLFLPFYLLVYSALAWTPNQLD